jgi:phospholipase C
VPQQEKGVRPARALPYELNVHAEVNASAKTVTLKFFNTGFKTVVFQVRSGNPSDLVRTYTVEPGKQLSDSWSVGSSYDLKVYGPNGFVRYFTGSTGSNAARLDVFSEYRRHDSGSIQWAVANVGGGKVDVNVLDAYTGNSVSRHLGPDGFLDGELLLEKFGWYDLIVTVAGDPSFNYRLAGHVETGRDSFSDPALGGLTLKG